MVPDTVTWGAGRRHYSDNLSRSKHAPEVKIFTI